MKNKSRKTDDVMELTKKISKNRTAKELAEFDRLLNDDKFWADLRAKRIALEEAALR